MTFARSFVIAIVLMLASPANAAGWTTVVQDLAGGFRVASLRGMQAEDPEVGMTIACDADSTLPPLLTVVFPPAGELSLRVGDAASLVIAGLRLETTIDRNDSSQTAASTELSRPNDLIASLFEATHMVRFDLSGESLAVEMEIQVQGLRESLDQIQKACPGLSG